MTRQEVIAGILVCAEKLGHTPSRAELIEHGGMSKQQVLRHFGTYKQALKECNLERAWYGRQVPMDRLFEDWAGVVRTLKKVPTVCEYDGMSRFSVRPLTRRFGSWLNVAQGMKEYVEKEGLKEEWKDVLELIDQALSPARSTLRTMTDQPMYGPPVTGCPLMFAPLNEAGVLYLFGALSERLGFVVLRVQTEYPDCEAMRVVGDQRLQRVRIEVEYESRNFLRHMHDPAGCDLIVCWENNWPECPLEVLELKSLVGIQRQEIGQDQDLVKRWKSGPLGPRKDSLE